MPVKEKNISGIIIDTSDVMQMREVMDKYGKSKSLMIGENSDGEMVLTSIWPEYIFMEIHQNNGWRREVYFYRDGTVEEMFKGPQEFMPDYGLGYGYEYEED